MDTKYCSRNMMRTLIREFLRMMLSQMPCSNISLSLTVTLSRPLCPLLGCGQHSVF